MAQLNRRLFIIGSAAFVAAAPTFPDVTNRFAAIGDELVSRSTAILGGIFPYRAIVDIMFSFVPTSAEAQQGNAFGTFRIYRAGNKYPLFNASMNLLSTMRWVSMGASNEIIVTEQDGFLGGLLVEVEPALTVARMSVIYNVEPDREKRIRLFCEDMTWNGSSDLRCSSPMPLDPRDSDMVDPPKRGIFSRLLGSRA